MGLLRVLWTVATTWWNQPLFEIPVTWWSRPLFKIPLEQLLHGFAPPAIPAAVTTITTAARGARWLKGPLLALGAAVTHLARNQMRNRASAAAAHVFANQLPHAAPMPWRVAWFVLTSVLTLIGPPAVKVLQKIHASRQKLRANATADLVPTWTPPIDPLVECSVDGLMSDAWQDAVQACLPSMIPCLLALVLGNVIGRARGWIKATPVVPLEQHGQLRINVPPDSDENSV